MLQPESSPSVTTSVRPPQRKGRNRVPTSGDPAVFGELQHASRLNHLEDMVRRCHSDKVFFESTSRAITEGGSQSRGLT